MADKKPVSLCQRQKAVKPLVEDAIREHLDGETQALALDLAAHMRENKMTLQATGIKNAWGANYKGKKICAVRLGPGWWNEAKDAAWVVTPCLDHMDEYQGAVMEEGLQNFVWDNLFYCVHVLKGGCNSHNCAPGRDVEILGKEIKGICRGRPPVWFHDPGKAAITAIKRLLELEQKAREEEAAAKKRKPSS